MLPDRSIHLKDEMKLIMNVLYLHTDGFAIFGGFSQDNIEVLTNTESPAEQLTIVI